MCDSFLRKEVNLDVINEVYSKLPVVSPFMQYITEKATIQQNNNRYWHEIRLGRITASQVGRICKLKNGKPEKIVKDIFRYSNVICTEAMQKGLEMEGKVVEIYENQLNAQQKKIRTEKCGIFISRNYSFIAASPDRIVKTPSENYLLEVKCKFPRCTNAVNLRELMSEMELPIKLTPNNVYELKRDHFFYYQIQTQMFCTEFKKCDLVLYFNGDIAICTVHFDAKFFYQEVLPKLEWFYKYYVLAEKLYRRVENNLDMYPYECGPKFR